MSFTDIGEGLPGIFGGMGGNFMPAMMIAFSSGLKAIGTAGQGQALVDAAKRRQQAAHFEAEQLRVNAGQAFAESQRAAHFEGQKGEILASAIRARMGAGASDPTGINLLAEVMSRRAYNMQAALYSGRDRARLMNMQAGAKEYDAALAVQDARAGRRSHQFAAIGALAEGGASLYQKYWPKDQQTGYGAGEGTFTEGTIEKDSLYGDFMYDDSVMVADGGRRKGGTTDTYGIRG